MEMVLKYLQLGAEMSTNTFKGIKSIFLQISDVQPLCIKMAVV